MKILKRRDFSKWQLHEGLPDSALCEAVREMQCGLVDAVLGGGLYKKRIGRPSGGKRGGHRTLLAVTINERYVFLHGFNKNDKSNISHEERKALLLTGKSLLRMSMADLERALHAGILLEVDCAKQTH